MLLAYTAHIFAEDPRRAGFVRLKVMKRFQISLHKSHDCGSVVLQLALSGCDRCIDAPKAHFLRAPALHIFRHTAKNQERTGIAEHSDLDAARLEPLRDTRRSAHLKNRNFGFFQADFPQRGAQKRISARTVLSHADDLTLELFHAVQFGIRPQKRTLRGKARQSREHDDVGAPGRALSAKPARRPRHSPDRPRSTLERSVGFPESKPRPR